MINFKETFINSKNINIMINIRKILISIFSILLFTAYSYADIHITVYGKGGIVVKPDGTQTVCPETASLTCSNITIEDESLNSGTINFNGINAVMVYKNETFEIQIVECKASCNQNGFYSQSVSIKINK